MVFTHLAEGFDCLTPSVSVACHSLSPEALQPPSMLELAISLFSVWLKQTKETGNHGGRCQVFILLLGSDVCLDASISITRTPLWI